MRRMILLSTALALLLAGCTGASPADPSGGGKIGTSPSVVPTSPADTTRLDVYETVLRHLVGGERSDWEVIYVQERICDNAGSGLQQRDCDERFSSEDQRGLAARLGDLGATVTFLPAYRALGNRIMSGRQRGVFVWMGPLEHGPGASLEVGGSMSCGGLCGSGSTWKVVPAGSGWKVDGSAAGAGTWIA
jgi:hypothetical protein